MNETRIIDGMKVPKGEYQACSQTGYSCGRCGAMVPDGREPLHDKWHFQQRERGLRNGTFDHQ